MDVDERELAWFTPEIIDVQRLHTSRFERLFSGESLPTVLAVAGPTFGHSHGLAGTNEIDMLEEPEAWLDDVLDDMAAQAGLLADRGTFRPAGVELDAVGVHFVDAVLGAHVYFHGDQVWADKLDEDLADLELPDLGSNAFLEKALTLARLAVSASRGRFFVTTPVLSCPINIAINLFGQRILEALLTRPDDARHALRVIADTIVGCWRAFMAVIPSEIRRTTVVKNRYQPANYGFIDGCAVQLVSAQVYRRFFSELDREILAVAPEGGQIHLCGACAQHIPTWREMPELRCVQLNDRAADDLQLYYNGLRRDQVIYVGPTEAMSLARIIGISGGSRVVIQQQLDEPIRVR